MLVDFSETQRRFGLLLANTMLWKSLQHTAVTFLEAQNGAISQNNSTEFLLRI
jgi:hypothetical protein